MEAQVNQLRAYAALRDLAIVAEYADQRSGKDDPYEREGLRAALESLEHSGGDILVVSKLDRISRNTMHVLRLLEAADRQGWELVALDLGSGTKTPEGKLQATIMAALAEFERDRIAQRIKDALRARAQRGTALGRPSRMAPALVEATRAIVAEDDTLTLREISAQLQQRGWVTSVGTPFSPTHVSRILRVVHAQDATHT